MGKNAYPLLRLLAGATRVNLKPLADTIECYEGLIFELGMDEDDIQVTKHVYPVVAKRLKKTSGSVARAVERATNLCWERMTPEQKLTFIGRDLDDISSLSEFTVYLSYYIHYGKPYFEIMRALIT